MLTAVGVQQGNVVTDGLNAWFDFGNYDCFIPTEGTGSITAGTVFNNLAPGQSAVSGTINGAVNWSTAFGGCMNLTSAATSTLQYTAGLSASFTTQIVVTPGTDASPDNNWTNDNGAWPGYRATNGFLFTQQNGGVTPGNFVRPILFAGASGATLPAGTIQPAAGWTEYMRFPTMLTFSTNGSNLHNTYTNNILKATDTTTRTRGDSAVGTIWLNQDTGAANRRGLGRVVAYLHYNRQLSDQEVYQNAQFYLNRVGRK